MTHPDLPAEQAYVDHAYECLDRMRAVVERAADLLDEAQDLTPMQLRMVARRARAGSVTILGDIAQATGPVVHDRWDDVLAYLGAAADAEVAELRHAYRVPAEIMNLALPLLDVVAPGVAPPVAFRSGAAAPRVERVAEGDLVTAALREALALAGEEGLLAVILPDALVPELAGHSAYDDGIPLLSPRRAKGLEFDHVVVVEPALIADGETGLRELYVALTRSTTTLVVVHARPLPQELSARRAG